jgi:hypothetical protein
MGLERLSNAARRLRRRRDDKLIEPGDVLKDPHKIAKAILIFFAVRQICRLRFPVSVRAELPNPVSADNVASSTGSSGWVRKAHMFKPRDVGDRMRR